MSADFVAKATGRYLCVSKNFSKVGGIMIKRIAAMIAVAVVGAASAQGSLPTTTGIIATDWNGKTYDIDALLAAGKHIWVHQMFAG